MIDGQVRNKSNCLIIRYGTGTRFKYIINNDWLIKYY